MDFKTYKRDCGLGALGAFLMLVGDLCLSVIPAHPGDKGLFDREAYLNGSWEEWRLPLLLSTGLSGMSLGYFTVKASYQQIKPEHRKTRLALLIGGMIYIATAGTLHFFIGNLADWTSRLSPQLGRDKTKTLIASQYKRLIPAMLISYAGMILFILTNAYAVITKKTVLPKWMIAFHLIVVEALLVLVPDIRQGLGAKISTWDFVMSQGSGNAALCIWMIANAVWAAMKGKKDC